MEGINKPNSTKGRKTETSMDGFAARMARGAPL
jgi:hypothetical protein